jgi:hypothetical protein
MKVLGAPIRKVPLGSAEMANSAWVKAGIKAEYIQALDGMGFMAMVNLW